MFDEINKYNRVHESLSIWYRRAEYRGALIGLLLAFCLVLPGESRISSSPLPSCCCCCCCCCSRCCRSRSSSARFSFLRSSSSFAAAAPLPRSAAATASFATGGTGSNESVGSRHEQQSAADAARLIHAGMCAIRSALSFSRTSASAREK